MSNSKNKWVLVEWDGEALWPHASYDLDILSGLKKNSTVRIQAARPRSQSRHRLYRVVLRQVVKNTDLFTTEDSLHKTLLLGCGVVEPCMDASDGSIRMIPSSTAFDAMSEDDFKAYFDRALEIISTHIIPDLDIDDLLKEARQQANWKEAA